MKKYLLLALVTLLTLGLASTAMAQIVNSVHDLSGASTPGNNELCIVCHTPHNAMSTDILWNHADSANTSFVMYDSSYMSQLPPASPLGISKLCLSCHDGSTSVDSYGSVTGSINIISFGAPAGRYEIGGSAVPDTTDLSTTHPISIEYPDGAGTADDPDIKVRGTTFTLGQSIGDNLDSGNLECSTCHDVHNSASEVANGTPLLRETMAASALCLICHDK